MKNRKGFAIPAVYFCKSERGGILRLEKRIKTEERSSGIKLGKTKEAQSARYFHARAQIPAQKLLQKSWEKVFMERRRVE